MKTAVALLPFVLLACAPVADHASTTPSTESFPLRTSGHAAAVTPKASADAAHAHTLTGIALHAQAMESNRDELRSVLDAEVVVTRVAAEAEPVQLEPSALPSHPGLQEPGIASAVGAVEPDCEQDPNRASCSPSL